jgi:glycosyltransferase involved in cell wall biosynthesis
LIREGPVGTIKKRTFNDFIKFNEKISPIRQGMIDDYLKESHDYVFWIDADLIYYPANLPSQLIDRNPSGISAPLVFLEGEGERFFDTAGFVENKIWCKIYRPFFKQEGPIYNLESVGCIYLVPANIYRDGAKHTITQGFTEHMSVCLFAIKQSLPVQAFDDLIAIHYNHRLWDIKEKDNPIKIIIQQITLRRKSKDKNFKLMNNIIKKKKKRKTMFLEKLINKKINNNFIDKLVKILFVIANYPQQILNSPNLINNFLRIFFKFGPYAAFQNAYDYLQLIKTRITSGNQKDLSNNKELELNYHQLMKDKFNPISISKLKDKLKKLKNKPKISIIMPVYNPDNESLISALRSIRNQVYNNWEVCIANTSDKANIKEILNDFLSTDSKFKIIHLKENKGISENFNEAIKLSTAPYIAIMDHDDELTPDALLEVAIAIDNNPKADLIYSDEDKMNLEGIYCQPSFKPDWCPDLLLTSCYFGHLVVIRKEILNLVNGFRKEFDGSQDHDLFLRITEITKNIIHIPKILYHWKMNYNSTALTIENKPYCYDKTIASIKDALNRRNISAKVIENDILGGPINIRYEIINKDLVSIIIPTKDQPKLLEKLINDIINKTTYDNYEILIINNNSKKKKQSNAFKNY